MTNDDNEGDKEQPEEGELPDDSPPPKPPDPVPDPPEELPTTSWMVAGAARGALVTLNGTGVRGNAVDVRAPIRVLEHFERLVRILRLHRSGLDVKRRGRLTEVQGAPKMLAVSATAGSYVVPLQLEMPGGEMVLEDHGELEATVALLGIADDDAIFTELRELPERVGDELIEILSATSAFDVDLDVKAFREETTTATASLEAARANASVGSLEKTSWSERGVDQIRGTLFRIDTKRGRIAVDAEPEEEDAEPIVVEAAFSMDKLEELRAALHHRVEIEVNVQEERRRYERTARRRTVSVTSITVPDASGGQGEPLRPD